MLTEPFVFTPNENLQHLSVNEQADIQINYTAADDSNASSDATDRYGIC
jgi:hypothetical protein